MLRPVLLENYALRVSSCAEQGLHAEQRNWWLKQEDEDVLSGKGNQINRSSLSVKQKSTLLLFVCGINGKSR